jgi:hypothetical protein
MGAQELPSFLIGFAILGAVIAIIGASYNLSLLIIGGFSVAFAGIVGFFVYQYFEKRRK